MIGKAYGPYILNIANWRFKIDNIILFLTTVSKPAVHRVNNIKMTNIA